MCRARALSTMSVPQSRASHQRPPSVPGGPVGIARIEEDVVIKSFVLAGVMLAMAGAPAGHAQEQQSFKTIIGKGYEIKSVTFARGESTDNREIFVVTLQKDKSVAVCYFAAANWINLSPNSLDDSKRCDVR
jgi:hypothetical protein